MDHKPDAAAVIDAVERLSNVDTRVLPVSGLLPNVSATHVPIGLVPSGFELRTLKPLIADYADRPERIKGHVDVDDIESFIRYFIDYRVAGARIFCRIKCGSGWSASLTGILDYHQGAGDAGDLPAPSWCSHKVAYNFPASQELVSWLAATGRGLSQGGFAEHLEDRLIDVINPPADWTVLPADQIATLRAALNLQDDYGEEFEPDELGGKALAKLLSMRWGDEATMARLATQVDITSSQKAKAASDPKTGAKVITYQEDVAAEADGQKVTLPDWFLINIPLFEGGGRRLLPVRIKVRVKSGQPVWIVEVPHLARVLEGAVRAFVEYVESETGAIVLFGTRDTA